ncbi:MAG: glycosyl hydrolase family 18 protein [Candidatus Kapabacteria bacterium]|jgi:spore germination protein YaaH|nr:glycosyl hydrolase family 18 protein [Candidatus Kapabacteria bacterium]
MKSLLILLLIAVFTRSALAEDLFESSHQSHSIIHPHNETSSFNLEKAELKPQATTLNKKVLGWHPYWVAEDHYKTYDYDALSVIAFFSYEVDSATGGYTTIHGFDSSPMIEYAHDRNVKVVLTVSSFGYESNKALLSDKSKQLILIDSLVSIIEATGSDGVNLDFELVRTANRDDLTEFTRMLDSAFRENIPKAEISLDLPAVDWQQSFDAKELAKNCDYLIIMGYDYYWSGSETAGPVSPLDGGYYNITNSVNEYLNLGVPSSRLALGVSWYGYDWPVESLEKRSNTTGKATARTYAACEKLADQFGKNFDDTYKSVWVSYEEDGVFRQLWYTDSGYLTNSYDFVNSQDMAGLGIWALSYAGEDNELFEGIKSAYGSCSSVSDGKNQSLLSAHPNPFSQSTTISYELSESAHVTLTIYDLHGNEIITLINEYQTSGEHSAVWNGKDNFKLFLNSAVCYYSLKTGNDVSTTNKLLHLK